MYRTGTARTLELKCKKKDTYGMTQNKMVQPSNGRQEERKELIRNKKGKTVGRKKPGDFSTIDV